MEPDGMYRRFGLVSMARRRSYGPDRRHAWRIADLRWAAGMPDRSPR